MASTLNIPSELAKFTLCTISFSPSATPRVMLYEVDCSSLCPGSRVSVTGSPENVSNVSAQFL